MVQIREGADGLWRDVAEVTVPPRTKRRNVIRAGMEKAQVAVAEGHPLEVRALNAESAHITPVALAPAEPQLKIG